MKRRGHFFVSGRVQGVCYRMYACREAERLGVTGWVRNLPDGTVESVAEGEEDALAAFRDWCGRGPPHARVTRVEESYLDATGEFPDFRIAY
jgi:acylphosphatase